MQPFSSLVVVALLLFFSLRGSTADDVPPLADGTYIIRATPAFQQYSNASSCLIVESGAESPSRYQWEDTSDRLTCGIEGGAAALYADQSAVWRFRLVPYNVTSNNYTYTITSLSNGTERCLTLAPDYSEYPVLALGNTTDDINTCNTGQYEKDILWYITAHGTNFLGEPIYTIKHDHISPDSGLPAVWCVIFSGNGELHNPSVWYWSLENSDESYCGLPDRESWAKNTQGVWMIDPFPGQDGGVPCYFNSDCSSSLCEDGICAATMSTTTSESSSTTSNYYNNNNTGLIVGLVMAIGLLVGIGSEKYL